MSIQWLQRLEAVGLSHEQAQAIASMPEERLVTHEHLDAATGRLEAKIEKAVSDLTWRILGVASLVIVVVGLIDKFVR